MSTRIRLATQLIRSCTGHGAAAGAGVAMLMCDGGGASQALPWQSEFGTALPPSGPDAGDAVGDPAGAAGLPVVAGPVFGCVAELGLAAWAVAITGANAPKSSAAARARFFKIMAPM